MFFVPSVAQSSKIQIIGKPAADYQFSRFFFALYNIKLYNVCIKLIINNKIENNHLQT
jgi:hypothetical protein